MRSILRSRHKNLAANFGANGAGQIITLVIQFASVPLYLYFWSAEQYGIWILLSTIPGYLAISDFGLVGATANEMTTLGQQHKRLEANQVFQTALAVIAAMSGVIMVFAVGLVTALRWNGVVPNLDIAVASLVLALVSILTIFTSLVEATYRADDRYALGATLSNLVRLLEWAVSLIFLYFYKSYSATAAGYLAGRLIGALLMIWKARESSTFSYSFGGADVKRAAKIIKPAAGFMLLPIGNILTIQSVTIAIGTFLGPASVAQFSVCRTISRGVVQASTVINKSIWPEITRLYASQRLIDIKSLFRRARFISVLLSVFLCTGIFTWKDVILSKWTHDQISVSATLLLIFLGCSLGTSLWQSSMTVLSATNNHYYFAKGYSLIAILISLAIFAVAGFGPIPVAMLLLINELALVAWSSFRLKDAMGKI